jgi:hypothetical protein
MDMLRLNLNGSAKINKTHILLACMPKSGSTYLSSIIASFDGFEKVSLVPGYDRREQELDTAYLVYANRVNYIAHHHVKYSLALGDQIAKFGITPVVLVRDIFDTCISLRDHFRIESTRTSLGYVPDDVVTWDDSDLELFIAHVIVPWYFSFYISWMNYGHKELITYNDLVDSPIASVKRVVQCAGVRVSEREVANALEKAEGTDTRRNVAVRGRGEQIAASARKQIIRIASFYQNIDFTPIGIERLS